MDIIYRHIRKETTGSTNSDLAELSRREVVDDFTVISAQRQTAGRGQRGNSWESAPGKNLTFSIVVHPSFLDISRHFLISEITALAVKDTLSHFIDKISIKWPNDIYWRDLKICGILIENELQGGRIMQSLAGIGINVNQKEFLSDAPNPVSLLQITGREYNIDYILDSFVSRFAFYYDCLKNERFDEIKMKYLPSLYRRDTLHAFRDSRGRFKARIVDVLDHGPMILIDTEGIRREYMFKEVEYII